MRPLLLLCFLYITFFATAQEKTKTRILNDSSKKLEADDYDQTFTKTEIEASYPGDSTAWAKFLGKTFRYPDEAISRNIQGVVIVQFIVNKDSTTSDFLVVSGPKKGGLREEAIRVIQLSGKWAPAIQNGRQVRAYKLLPFTFKLFKG